MFGALLDVLLTVGCLVLMLKAAGWALRGGRPQVRVRGGGYSGGSAALVLVLVVGTVVTFVLALVTGHVW